MAYPAIKRVLIHRFHAVPRPPEVTRRRCAVDEVCSKVGHCTFEEKACAVTAGKIATSILSPPANVAIHFRVEHLGPHSIVDPSLDTSRDASHISTQMYGLVWASMG